MIITIKRVEDAAKGERKWKLIYYDNKEGKEITKNIFLEEKYDLLVPGATVEIIQEKDKETGYWNVKDIKPVTLKEAVAADKSSDFATFHMRQTSIERQNALTNAVIYITGGTIPEVLKAAGDFYAWTSKGIIPEDDTIPAQEETPEKKDLVKPGITSVLTPDAVPMKTYDDLFAAASSLYSLSQADVLEILGATENKGYLKGYLIGADRKVISPVAAWTKVKKSNEPKV